ncbi:MAG: hypothetical protein H6828_12300 [Planctomycetes bacterium]|nr:hypothetical protein [Planctomycetota bacterium]
MNRTALPYSCMAVGRAASVLLAGLGALTSAAQAQDTTYTTDADFDLGVLLNVNHDAPNSDQLQLGTQDLPFPFVSVANSGNDTVVRIDALTGVVLGEYRTAPNGEAKDPSRATVDLAGNTWVGNRAEDLLGITGSVTKVGVVIGGTRVNAAGVPDANGEFLVGPFEYSTAVDRDGDGRIRTSRGLGDDLDWPAGSDVTGGAGGGPALVQDALDELVLVYQKTTGVPNVRSLSVDAQNDLWVGGYTITPNRFRQLDDVDGSFLGASFDASVLGCGGYGGVVDANGILWSVSPNQRSLLRLDTATMTGACINFTPSTFTPRGVALDAAGNVWVAGGGEVRRLDAAGNETAQFPVAVGGNLHGLVVHPLDQSIFVADFAGGNVLRVDSGTGAVIATIPAGTQPNGVAVDAFGKVWVSCQGSDDVRRIDDASNAVDLVVPLGNGSQPFNPSDMTGSAAYTSTLRVGSWSVVTDGGQTGTLWDNVLWSANVPQGAQLAVSARSAESQAGLTAQAFAPVANGAGIVQVGRFLEVKVDFQKSAVDGSSPVLFDLTVEGDNDAEPPRECVEIDRRRAGSLLLYPEFDNRSGRMTLLTLTHVGDAADVTAEFVYIDGDDCSEFNRTETLTPHDTLTLLTPAHNPQQELGYLYVFAKDRQTGAPVAANVLIGNEIVLDGLDAFEYGVNAVCFQALTAGETDVDGDGLLDLDGVEYTQAPDQVLIPRFFGQLEPQQQAAPGAHRSQLVMIALTGGALFDTTLDFLIYNDNEEVFSAEHTFRCWEKTDLLSISGIFGNGFLQTWTNDDPDEILGASQREAGWFRIEGAQAQSTTTTILNPAFYAVLVERIGPYAVADLPFESCSQPGGVLLPRSLTGE